VPAAGGPTAQKPITGDRATTLSSLIDQAERGNRSAAEALFSALYAKLHRLAQRELAFPQPAQGPQTYAHKFNGGTSIVTSGPSESIRGVVANYGEAARVQLSKSVRA
jgi:ECF sigma factor